MGLHQLRATQPIPLGLDEAWAFLSDPRNLKIITPPWLGMHLTSEPPEKMYPGLIITYKISPLGPVFASPNIQKIFHAAEYDIYVLKRDCSDDATTFQSVPFIETSIRYRAGSRSWN